MTLNGYKSIVYVDIIHSKIGELKKHQQSRFIRLANRIPKFFGEKSDGLFKTARFIRARGAYESTYIFATWTKSRKVETEGEIRMIRTATSRIENPLMDISRIRDKKLRNVDLEEIYSWWSKNFLCDDEIDKKR